MSLFGHGLAMERVTAAALFAKTSPIKMASEMSQHHFSSLLYRHQDAVPRVIVPGRNWQITPKTAKGRGEAARKRPTISFLAKSGVSRQAEWPTQAKILAMRDNACGCSATKTPCSRSFKHDPRRATGATHN